MVVKNVKKFETAKINLQVRSGHYHSVLLTKITAPEYLILQHVHGSPQAADFIEVEKEAAYLRKLGNNGKWLIKPVSQGELTEKLILKYGEKNFHAVFPGANAKLPYAFSEINVFSSAATAQEEVDGDWEEVEGNLQVVAESDPLDTAIMNLEKVSKKTPEKKTG